MLTQKNKYLPYLMWLLPLLFFAYQFILRLWPGLMMHQIMMQFSINASHFGLLAAFYYYGYSGMQIPVAILLDRFGARYIVFTFATICGLATLIFIHTDNFYLAVLSRFLIGAGSAVGFLGVSKIVSEWFPKKQYSQMIGFSFTFGLMGAIYGGKPVSLLIEMYSWKEVALTLALVSIILGIGAFLALRSPKEMESHQLEKATFKMANLTALLSSPLMWCLGIANLLMVGSLEGFADVWGVPYLMIAYNLSKADAAGLVTFIFFGMLFGGPILALCSRKFGNYLVIFACGLGMAFSFTLLLSNHTYNWLMLAILFFAIGVMCCYQIIVFAAGADLVKPQYLGVTVAFLNCINMLGGSFFHTIIGKLMDVFWNEVMGLDGVRLYNLEVYKYALAIIPVCALFGALLVSFIGFKVHRKNSKLIF